MKNEIRNMGIGTVCNMEYAKCKIVIADSLALESIYWISDIASLCLSYNLISLDLPNYGGR